MPIGAIIDGYFKGVDQAEERSHRRALRAAEIEALPDRVAAERSQSQLRAQQNQGALGLVGAQTENAQKRIQHDNYGLDAAISRQPDEAATEANKAMINKVLSQYSVEDLPNVIAEHRTNRLFDITQAQIAGIAKLHDLLRVGDERKVVGFLNAMRKANPDIGLNDDVAKVSVTEDPQSGDYMFSALDGGGNPLLQMSATQMQAVSNMAKPTAKEDYKVVKPGHSLVRMRNGIAEEIYNAPESQSQRDAASRGGSKPTQLEQNLDMLTGRLGMSEREALAYLNTSKTISRDQFILDSVKNLTAIGRKPTEEDVIGFGEIYDSTRNSPDTRSNSRDEGNLDPRIRSLIGIP